MASPSNKLLAVPYHRQADDGYCLPACVQMVLAHLGLPESQESLADRLGVCPPLGAPASSVTHLRSNTVEVSCTSGTLDDLRSHVTQELAPIVFVQAGELAHWRGHASQHAVVAVGIDEQAVHILDPAAGAKPISISLGDFLLAWIEMECLYALLAKKE